MFVNIGSRLSITGNLSFAAGVQLGVPRNQADPSITFDTKPLPFTKYSVIGIGALTIYRVDATFAKRLSLFVAGTVHQMRTFDQKPNKGEFKGKNTGSAAISIGATLKFGKSL